MPEEKVPGTNWMGG